MASSIHHKLYFPHPAEIVWEYLTKAELIAQWLMENDFQPIVGHDFQFRAKPIPDVNFDGIVYCKVLEIIPLKKLSYSWKTGPGNGRILVDSLVEWTLLAKEEGTELRLDHTGITEKDYGIYSLMDAGWFKNINRIAELINNAKQDTRRV